MSVHHINGLTIVTIHEYPPIPLRCWDYRAHVKDYDEETGISGWGETPEAAIKDLLLLLEDET